ncbi:hypothetical protein THTE_2360 [Thermogutta terrifontis]|uniref:Methyltransferase FkbM domain-containing protein n=1 Tax=Thermogutta terrifontis TaxID=1331910 RepID=A0A286RG94_9BACT|nr:hypothetical protein THTE_2360 [Thermogutta terrifontis]
MSFRTKSEHLGLTVPVVTPDELVHAVGGPVDLIKCDIEGAEGLLFDTTLFTTCRALVIELHERYYPGVTELFRRYVHKRKGSILPLGEYLTVIFH